MTDFTDNEVLKRLAFPVYKMLAPRSMLLIPLISNEKVIGLFEAMRAVPTTDEELKRLEVVAGQLTNAIARKQAEQALMENELRYRTLVDTSPDSIVLTDLEGKVILCNQQTARLHGYDSPEGLRSVSTFELIAPEDRQLAADNVRKTLETGQVTNIEYTLLRKDGSRFPAELSAALVCNAKGDPEAFIEVTRDITGRKQAQMEIARRLQNIEALQKIDQAIAGSLDLKLTLHVVLEQTKSELNADAAAILLFNPHAQMLEFASGIGFRCKIVEFSRLRFGERHAGRAALERKTVSVLDLSDAERSGQFPRATLLTGTSARRGERRAMRLRGKGNWLRII